MQEKHQLNTNASQKLGFEFKKLNLSQKISVIAFSIMALTIPLLAIFALQPIRSAITPASGPISSTATPTPPPSFGNIPVFMTKSIANAYVGRNYRATIEAYDLDVSDKLEIRMSGPLWLTLSNCRNQERNLKDTSDSKVSYINCTISGRPSETGTSTLTFELSDGQNKITTIIYLQVNE